MKLKDYQTIIDLCDEIQEKTPYCAFFDFSGHIYEASVRVSASKKDYQSRIYDTILSGNKIKDIESRLKEILQDGLTSLSLVAKVNESDIKRSYKAQLDLGVAKIRAIANISKEFNLTQNKVAEIVK